MIQECDPFPPLIWCRCASDLLPSRFHHSSCSVARHLLSWNCFYIFASDSPCPPLRIRRDKFLVIGTPPPHSALSETLPYSENDTSSLPVCFVTAASSTFGTAVRESFPPGGSHFRLRRQWPGSHSRRGVIHASDNGMRGCKNFENPCIR